MTAALPEAVLAAGTPVEVWFQDEARVGQQGTLAYVWAETGTRPRAPKDLRYEWAKLVKVPPAKQVEYQRRATCSAPCAPSAARAPPW